MLWRCAVFVKSLLDSSFTFVVKEVDDVVVVVVGGDVVVDVSFPLDDRPCVSSSHEVGVCSVEGVDGDVVEVAVAVG